MAHLALLLPVLLLLAAADAFPASCTNVTCGGHAIRYPFWLNSSASDCCGYPGLGLACEDDNATLILPVQSHRYRVVGIDYATHTVSVSDADVDEHAAGCPRLRLNLTIDTTSSWLRLAPSDSNITFLYDCKKSISSSSSSAVELSGCRDHDDGRRSYVLPDGGITGAEAHEYECDEVVVAPVLGVHKEGMVPAPGAAQPPLMNGSFGGVVSAGFELMYNAHSEQCNRCERSGGWCGYRRNETRGGMLGFTCFCDGGPTSSERCGSMCSDSFYCGSVEIRYPFHLSNATGVADGYSTPYSCGYTDLNITCHPPGEGATWTPIIQLGQGSYRVLSIAYDTSSIILSDADAFGRGGSGTGCPTVRHNVTFGHEWLRYDADSRANLTFFFGCYAQSSVPAGLDAYRISCPDFVGSPGGGVSFVFAHNPEEDDETDDDDLEGHCSEVFVAPVQSDSPLLRGNNRSALPREYGAVLRQGFELAWSTMTTDGCHLCEQPGSGGGRCAYGRSREFLGCLCPDGTVGTQDCRNSGAAPAPTPSKSFTTDQILRLPHLLAIIMPRIPLLLPLVSC
ncbi:hypothetical protein ACP70R_036975 [Stipagrostis hirtigluma subsp. patula]